MHAILGSLLSSLIELPTKLDVSPHQRALIKREANVLRKIVGPLNSQSQELWDNVSSVFLNREWNEGHGRVFVCWTAGADNGVVDTEGDFSALDFVTWASKSAVSPCSS